MRRCPLSEFDVVVVKLSGRFFENREGNLSLLTSVVNMLARWAFENRGNRVVTVVGGGNIARGRDVQNDNSVEAREKRYRTDLMGMLSSCVNGITLCQIMCGESLKAKHFTSRYGEPNLFIKLFQIDDVWKAMRDGYKAIVISGGTEPGVSTDTRAVEVAREFGSDTLFKLTHGVLGLHESDPRINTDAPLLDSATYQQLRDLGGGTLFDPGVIKAAEEGELALKILHPCPFGHPYNLQEALRGGNEFVGTTVE